MALKNTTLIRFPRCKYVASSRQIAMVHLMEDFNHVVGQPVVVSYYKDQSHTDIDTIVAMGVKNGKGKDCFKVITTGQFIIIWDIVYSLPDVSSLVHGEVYLYNDRVTNIWYTVSLNPESMGRDIEPITEDPKFYIRLTDNTLWVSDADLIVRPLSSIYTKKEIDDIIEEIKIETDFSKIEELLHEAIEKSNYASEKVDQLEERIDEIEEGSASLKVIAQLHNYIKAINLVRVYGEPSTKTWYGKNETRVFEAESLEFEIIYHNYDGDIMTGFDKVTIAIGEEPETEIVPNQDGYYTNPMSLILPEGRDFDIPLNISVTYNGTTKSGALCIYGLSEFRYTGRVDNPDSINLESLNPDSMYTWNERLDKPEKSKENFTINSGEKDYFVYLYPESWGELQSISSPSLSYYNPGTTFAKKIVTIDDTNFLCYYYQNENRDEAINVNFL